LTGVLRLGVDKSKGFSESILIPATGAVNLLLQMGYEKDHTFDEMKQFVQTSQINS
jgi:hypothetical protein